MPEPPVPADPRVCVIIAAFNGAATIGRAVVSALDQPETAEVVVVDDASTDDTAAAARAVDDGSGRLSVVCLAANVGPSAARNRAIEASRSPFIAILDADDFFLPGRLAALFDVPDWDMIADSIAFVDESRVADIDAAAIAAHPVAARALPAAAFVRGCLTRRGRYKGELGFLKPLLSRAFLDAHGLRYARELRLSEDFDLYTRALLAGARFKIAAACRYVAVERRGSLSTSHGVAELTAVEGAMLALVAAAPPGSEVRTELQRLHAQTARKRRLRAVLARKRLVGALAALREEASTPAALSGVLIDIARDKLATLHERLLPAPPAPDTTPRFLL
ncbi:glycosyltransferase family 2 protein [Sphingomonas sp.]|uniref:glycosyltransferase family 2 protein n=1 Tax=Sphingomonas sp. TaxID=28214 RepID=UPI003CC5DF3A